MSEILKDVIRNNSGHWVANSYIDGNLWLIYSDYGNAAYHWSSTGCSSLKEIIVTCDVHYLARKLVEYNKQTEIDWENTKKSIKRYILRERREYELTKEVARNLWNDLYYCDCLEEYQNQTDVVDDLYEFVVHEESSYSKALREHVIKPLKELFAEQIKESVG